MIGCVIYTDPLDDGEITEENGYEAYPSKFHWAIQSIIMMLMIFQMDRLETRPPSNEAVFDSHLSIVETLPRSATHLQKMPPVEVSTTTLL